MTADGYCWLCNEEGRVALNVSDYQYDLATRNGKQEHSWQGRCHGCRREVTFYLVPDSHQSIDPPCASYAVICGDTT